LFRKEIDLNFYLYIQEGFDDRVEQSYRYFCGLETVDEEREAGYKEVE
jgi:hypothetical protein